MKLLRSFTIVALLAGGAYAQSPAPAKPAPTKTAPAEKAPAEKAPAKKPEVTKAEADQFLAFFNKFVDGVVAAKEDCTKMAATINTVIDQNQATIKLANDSKAAGKDLPQWAKEKMMARVKEMMPPMQKCGNDAKVQTAMKRMESGGTAKAAPKK